MVVRYHGNSQVFAAVIFRARETLILAINGFEFFRRGGSGVNFLFTRGESSRAWRSCGTGSFKLALCFASSGCCRRFCSGAVRWPIRAASEVAWRLDLVRVSLCVCCVFRFFPKLLSVHLFLSSFKSAPRVPSEFLPRPLRISGQAEVSGPTKWSTSCPLESNHSASPIVPLSISPSLQRLQTPSKGSAPLDLWSCRSLGDGDPARYFPLEP